KLTAQLAMQQEYLDMLTEKHKDELMRKRTTAIAERVNLLKFIEKELEQIEKELPAEPAQLKGLVCMVKAPPQRPSSLTIEMCRKFEPLDDDIVQFYDLRASDMWVRDPPEERLLMKELM